MSRTFNDQPWWYRATEWDQIHESCEFSYLTPWGRRQAHTRDCDLPPEPSLKAWRGWDSANWRAVPRRELHCMWVPKYPGDRRYSMPTPPKWHRDHIWNCPVRTREREYRQKALKEYRGSGEVESILPDEQHHHNAKWLYW